MDNTNTTAKKLTPLMQKRLVKIARKEANGKNFLTHSPGRFMGLFMKGFVSRGPVPPRNNGGGWVHGQCFSMTEMGAQWVNDNCPSWREDGGVQLGAYFTWLMLCDHDGCNAHATGMGAEHSKLIVWAADHGWRLKWPEGDILSFCPKHHPAED